MSEPNPNPPSVPDPNPNPRRCAACGSPDARNDINWLPWCGAEECGRLAVMAAEILAKKTYTGSAWLKVNTSVATPFVWNDDPEAFGSGATLAPRAPGVFQIDAFTVNAIDDEAAVTGVQWEIASQASTEGEARREVEIAIAAVEAYRAARGSGSKPSPAVDLDDYEDAKDGRLVADQVTNGRRACKGCKRRTVTPGYVCWNCGLDNS